jgi:hypothetical protein
MLSFIRKRFWPGDPEMAQDLRDAASIEAQFKRILWLSDAPLFIDEELVARFFDAIVRPKYEHLGEEQTRESEAATKIEGKLGITGKTGLHLPAWLKPIKLEVEGKGEFGVDKEKTEKTGQVVQLKPIWNAERQLEELTRHYLAHHANKLIAGDTPVDPKDWPPGTKWYEANEEYYSSSPRPLAFLDLPPGVQIIPTAAEFANGKVCLLFMDLAQKLTGEEGGPKEKYPGVGGIPDEKTRADRKAYWASYTKFYDSRAAMEVIEKASSDNGRIEWIDFRLPLGTDGDTVHLHVCPRGKYSAGTFGYNFVRRANNHGARLVGTLKTKPDMNVLAIYEK